eukprot:TRINITY_DN28563_c0_g1_i1.p2 TRINITY_DN28563_c0_g1~~TRINITY_DN28563_c0_g1_i1.p2  ORF type:complete len:101 (+),score=5.44 TRINITY_DN28563_c0_g1_i1:83-385(+)
MQAAISIRVEMSWVLFMVVSFLLCRPTLVVRLQGQRMGGRIIAGNYITVLSFKMYSEALDAYYAANMGEKGKPGYEQNGICLGAAVCGDGGELLCGAAGQ